MDLTDLRDHVTISADILPSGASILRVRRQHDANGMPMLTAQAFTFVEKTPAMAVVTHQMRLQRLRAIL